MSSPQQTRVPGRILHEAVADGKLPRPRNSASNMTPAKNESFYSVPALHRALDIIEALVHHQPRTVTELHRQFKIPKSSVYAILQTLKSRGYVTKDDLDEYALSLRLFSLGISLIENLDLRKGTHTLLEELTQKAQLTGHLAVRDGREAVYIDKVEVLTSVRLTTWLGRRVPLHSTSMGKAILAFLPNEEVDAILGKGPLAKLTPKTITNPAQLKAELAKIRNQGYAVGSEENEVGIRAVGAPILGPAGTAIGAVNLGATTLNFHAKDIPRLGALVRSYAEKISAISKHSKFRQDSWL
jgi:IclR family transcriptional regulator, KDG regulon repressor